VGVVFVLQQLGPGLQAFESVLVATSSLIQSGHSEYSAGIFIHWKSGGGPRAWTIPVAMTGLFPVTLVVAVAVV
jgi:hypothetical protein